MANVNILKRQKKEKKMKKKKKKFAELKPK